MEPAELRTAAKYGEEPSPELAAVRRSAGFKTITS
jgi:hypothetical protein